MTISLAKKFKLKAFKIYLVELPKGGKKNARFSFHLGRTRGDVRFG